MDHIFFQWLEGGARPQNVQFEFDIVVMSSSLTARLPFSRFDESGLEIDTREFAGSPSAHDGRRVEAFGIPSR